MRILDVNGNEVLNPDYSLGYLLNETIVSQHHEAIPAVEEVGHYEVEKEYPNGGQDLKWIIDVEGQSAVEAWDEYEDIYRYILYTQEELDKMAAEEAARKAAEEENERLRQQIAESTALINALLGVTEE